MRLLQDVQAVLTEYRTFWPLTNRQIFYRLVGAYAYPKTEQFYESLLTHMANARRARVIAFDAIRDDGISVLAPEVFMSEDAFYEDVRARARAYTRDRQANQPFYIEVWCEAAGMVPQLAEVARTVSIPVYSCSGFDSVTAKKLLVGRICEREKPAVILHLGDFDPSGLSIYNVIGEDVAAFVLADRPSPRVTVEFRRVALTASQVATYQLPTAPPKKSDTRSKAWEGETCQLEALAPDEIADLLREAIVDLLDMGQYKADIAIEKVERERLAYALPAPRSGS